MSHKKNFGVAVALAFFYSFIATLAGYGMFYWYMQPFALKVPIGLALMLACLTSGFVGFYGGIVWKE